jgi:FkbM family methyltransferase
MLFKQQIKDLLVAVNLPITKNLKYDRYTIRILAKILKPGSNCIDIGCHKGEILDVILKFSPEGKHYAFEPLPFLFDFLRDKYKSKNISVHQVALFDKKGKTTFHYVENAPAYSGLKKRQYDTKDAKISEIEVETELLDNIIPETECIDFIKIDVEGAEFGVFKGGIRTLSRCKPTIIFEFGLGAADYYGTTPAELFSLLTKDCGLKISTLRGFLYQKEPLTEADLSEYYRTGKEYYFVAHS